MESTKTLLKWTSNKSKGDMNLMYLILMVVDSVLARKQISACFDFGKLLIMTTG